MIRALRSKSLWAFVLPFAIAGLAFGGGPDCAKTQTASGEVKHCHLSKSVTKTAELTKDGAVITLEGKSEEATSHLRSHLEMHAKGGETDCPGCPMAMEGVESTVELTKQGGKITLHGTSDQTIKTVQEWAQKPFSCCGKESA